MKIALFTGSVEDGAFSAVFCGLCHAFAENGIQEIDMLTASGDPGQSTNEFPPVVNHVRLPGGRVAYSAFWLRRYLRDRSPDVLITGPIYVNLVSIIAVLTSSWRGKLIITHHHPIGLAHSDGWKNNKYLSKLLYRFAQGSIAVSPGVREEAIRVAGLMPSKVDVIPNVLPPKPKTIVSPPRIPFVNVKNRHGPVFVSLSRLDRKKNIPLLVEAFSRISKEIDANLLIIGDGPDRDAIDKSITMFGQQNRVRMLGFVESPRVYLKQSDVFVLASSEEGFGQVIVEAMNEALPVICTDAEGGGVRYILGDGRYGVLVPMNDLEALTEAMRQMANAKLRAQYAKISLNRSKDFLPKILGMKWRKSVV